MHKPKLKVIWITSFQHIRRYALMLSWFYELLSPIKS